MKDELLKNLTDEQLEKARECKSEEELLDLAKKEGIKLTDEQLASVSGGCGAKQEEVACPICGNKNLDVDVRYVNSSDQTIYTCPECGHQWKN